jgi:hypothetical protein
VLRHAGRLGDGGPLPAIALAQQLRLLLGVEVLLPLALSVELAVSVVVVLGAGGQVGGIVGVGFIEEGQVIFVFVKLLVLVVDLCFLVDELQAASLLALSPVLRASVCLGRKGNEPGDRPHHHHLLLLPPLMFLLLLLIISLLN